MDENIWTPTDRLAAVFIIRIPWVYKFFLGVNYYWEKDHGIVLFLFLSQCINVWSRPSGDKRMATVQHNTGNTDIRSSVPSLPFSALISSLMPHALLSFPPLPYPAFPGPTCPSFPPWPAWVIHGLPYLELACPVLPYILRNLQCSSVTRLLLYQPLTIL